MLFNTSSSKDELALREIPIPRGLSTSGYPLMNRASRRFLGGSYVGFCRDRMVFLHLSSHSDERQTRGRRTHHESMISYLGISFWRTSPRGIPTGMTDHSLRLEIKKNGDIVLVFYLKNGSVWISDSLDFSRFQEFIHDTIKFVADDINDGENRAILSCDCGPRSEWRQIYLNCSDGNLCLVATPGFFVDDFLEV
mgnify:FL=1